MQILDPKYRNYSHDSTEFGKYSDQLEAALTLDKGKNHRLNAYLDHIGGSITPLPNEITYNADPIGKHDKIEFGRSGELHKQKKSIEGLLKDKEKLETKISQTTDEKKLKSLQGDVKKIDNKLADFGKESQKVASRTIDRLNEHLEDVGKAHEKAVEALEKHQRDVSEALERLELAPAGSRPPIDASKVTGLGDAKINVKLDDGREFLLEEGKISRAGNMALHTGKTIDAETVEKIRENAIEVSDKHIEHKMKFLEDAQAKHTEVIQDKIKHLEEHQSFLSDKTKVGKSVDGKTPTKSSPGTKLANDKGIIGEAKYNELSSMGKFGADVKANWKSGAFGKVKTGVGVVLVGDGVRRAFSAVAGSKDPSQGEAEGTNLVQLATGVGEAAAGLFTMRHGGAHIAMGA